MKSRAAGHTASKSGMRRPGRPQLHDESWTKVSVVLFTRQVAHLDDIAERIRRRGRSINRASLIRAVLDGVLASRVDLSVHPSEGHLRDDIKRRLKKPRTRF